LLTAKIIIVLNADTCRPLIGLIGIHFVLNLTIRYKYHILIHQKMGIEVQIGFVKLGTSGVRTCGLHNFFKVNTNKQR